MNSSNWQEVFQAIPVACLVLERTPDQNGVIIAVNDSYLELTGMRREDLLGKSSDSDFPGIDPDSKACHRSLLRVLKTGERDVVHCVRCDLKAAGNDQYEERYWNFQNIPLKSQEGYIEYILHTLEDVTQKTLLEDSQKELREEVEINRQQFRNFIRQNPDGMYRLDLQGKFLHVNEGLAKLAELPVEDILQTDFLPFCAPYDRERILLHFNEAVQGNTSSFEADFISAKGRTLILKILIMPMYLDGRVAEIHGIAKDISGLRQTQKVMVEKSRFLEVNAAFISSLLEGELDDNSLSETFGIVAQTIDADRMYYFGADKDPVSGEILISQKMEWCSAHTTVQLHNQELQNMPISMIEEITADLTKNLPFTARRSELKEGALKEIFIEQDIQSMLLLPIFVEDQIFGFVGFDDCRTERHWKEEEVAFLQSLTHNLTNVFEKKMALEQVREREEEIKRSERKFKALVQEGSDMIIITDLQGVTQFVSDTSKRILGKAPEELTGKKLISIVHPDDQEKLLEEFAELTHSKQKKSTAYRIRNKNGEWRWIQSVGTNLLEDPAVQGIVINSRDITTVIEQAQEIQQINERYCLAAAATQDLIYDWDLEKDQVTRFYQSPRELFGYSAEEVNHRDFWQDHIHPEDFEREKKQLDRVLADPKEDHIRTEYRFRRANGTFAKVIDKGYILRDPNGKAIRLIGATSDISDITSKKEALKIANQRFEMAMKATNEMIWDWDIESDSVTRSKGYKSIFGYDTNEATSVHSFWLTKVAPEDQIKIRASLKRAITDPRQDKWSLEYRMIKADGKIAYVTDRGYIIRDRNGRATRMVGAVLDVTHSRRMIRKIRRQNTVLKEIAWEQSHVVRAPLARIQGLLPLLEEGRYEEMSYEDILRHIRHSTEELDEIIRSIVGKTEEISAPSQV